MFNEIEWLKAELAEFRTVEPNADLAERDGKEAFGCFLANKYIDQG